MNNQCFHTGNCKRYSPKGSFFSPSLQRESFREGEQDDLQRKADTVSKNPSAHLQPTLDAGKGGGEKIPGDVQSHMENSMGADFSDVRIHRGAEAAELSTSVQAKAFTYGNDIY